MKILALLLFLAVDLVAENCRVLVDGAGCRTRQLAMQRIWEDLPNVKEVEILSREEAPAPNQRYFSIRCEGNTPTKKEFITALGRRAKHYIVLSVEPIQVVSPENN
jgi:hypothetical protein